MHDLQEVANPWRALPEPDFNRFPIGTTELCLATDKDFIEAYNSGPNRKLIHKVDLTLVPEPFSGPLDAQLLILTQNPGIDESTRASCANPDHRKHLINAVRSPETHSDYLHIGLDTHISPNNWWWKILRHLARDAYGKFGVTIDMQERYKASKFPNDLSYEDACAADFLKKKVLVVEYFPYHSEKYGFPDSKELPSQRYSFYLVNKAIERSAILIITRAQRKWLSKVPAVEEYAIKSGNVYTLSSWRRIIITRNNLKGYGGRRMKLTDTEYQELLKKIVAV